MLATLNAPTPAQWQSSFDNALTRFAQRYAPIPYSRTCSTCKKPIFSADTSATEQDGEWTHAACVPAQSENVISGAEVDGDDARDPFDQPEPQVLTDEESNRIYLLTRGWEPRYPDQWFDPISDLIVSTPYALGMQSARDFRDQLAGQPTEQN